MIISDTQKDFKIAPAGLHMARLYSIIDLGHQATEWAGENQDYAQGCVNLGTAR
jgi:hypothetical protein